MNYQSIAKSLVLACALYVGGFAQAQVAAPVAPAAPGAHHEDFAAHKAEVLSRMEKRGAVEAEARSCVAAAADRDALHACRDKAQASMRALHPRRGQR